MIVGAVLFVMCVISMFSLLFEMTFFGSILSFKIEGLQYLNNTSTEMDFPTASSDFFIHPIEGGIVILVAIITISAIIGIQILGSGLSDTAHRMVMLCTIYIGLWAILSVIALPLIWDIEVFGGIIYISLTLAYIIGIVKKFGEG